MATGQQARAQDETALAFPCEQKAAPTDAIEANKRFMNRFVDFINTADQKLAEELVSQKAIFYVPGRTDPVKGPEGYMAIVQMMRSGFPDIQWKLEDVVVEPDKVAARFIMHGTHEGAFLGVAASGRQISVQALNIYHVCDGQIVREYGQPDLLGLMQQIGALPH